MPPKKDEQKVKPKKEPPKELCGCGVDTYRPPPKGKKLPAPIIHCHDCPFQRTTCEAYPHLPPCEVCQYPCKFCLGKYRWCPHCYETQCTYRFKRVVLGTQRPPVIPPPPPPPKENPKNAKAPAGKPKAPPPVPELPPIQCPPYRPVGLRPSTLCFYGPSLPQKKKAGKKKSVAGAAPAAPPSAA